MVAPSGGLQTTAASGFSSLATCSVKKNVNNKNLRMAGPPTKGNENGDLLFLYCGDLSLGYPSDTTFDINIHVIR